MMEARDIRVVRGGKPILQGVSVAVTPGALTVVLGPNGSGKSTLLGALATDLAPAGGQVVLDGLDMRRMGPEALADRRAVLSQFSSLSFPFTVFEVVRLGLRAAVADPAGLIEDALARVDLAGFGARFYQTLSGGEQQRVQLARVMMQVWSPDRRGPPRYVLLDEPTSSLDLKHQAATLGQLRAFADAGGGVLAVLHDLNLAAAFADRLVVLKAGRMAAEGPPAAVLTAALMADVFEIPAQVSRLAGRPVVTPHFRGAAP